MTANLRKGFLLFIHSFELRSLGGAVGSNGDGATLDPKPPAGITAASAPDVSAWQRLFPCALASFDAPASFYCLFSKG